MARESCKELLSKESPAARSGAKLSPAERAAIVSRMDAGTATKADWELWSRDLDARRA